LGRAADRARGRVHGARASRGQGLPPLDAGRAAAGTGRPGAPLLHRDADRPSRSAQLAARAPRALGRPRIQAGDAMTRGAIAPPAGAERLLERAVSSSPYAADIAGDLHESFNALALRRSLTLARWWYRVQV